MRLIKLNLFAQKWVLNNQIQVEAFHVYVGGHGNEAIIPTVLLRFRNIEEFNNTYLPTIEAYNRIMLMLIIDVIHCQHSYITCMNKLPSKYACMQ